jgi:hypothetical protein
MMLGSGIQILEAALQKAARGGVTTPPFIPPMDIKVTHKSGVMTAFKIGSNTFNTSKENS